MENSELNDIFMHWQARLDEFDFKSKVHERFPQHQNQRSILLPFIVATGSPGGYGD